MIHEVRLQTNASCKTLKDYGILFHRSKSSLHHSNLQIKSLGDQVQSSSLDESTNLSDGYEIVGVNDSSCRGLTSIQVESMIAKEDAGVTVTILVRGGEIVDPSTRGMPGDCLCARGCSHSHACECECCIIQ
jgi:hypothetical protein